MDNGGPLAALRKSPGKPWWTRPGRLDLVACAALAALAGVAFLALPGGSVLRMALALSVLFFVPGYLLIEAAVGPARRSGARAVRALLAIGASPPLVGLLALATALLPGGFRAGPIVALLCVTCLSLAAAAAWRRAMPSRQTAPEPALA
jgi:uncharacterized membrane protein